MSDFMVWCIDYGQDQGDGLHIKDAYDHAYAAKEWAERYEARNAEYPIASGTCVSVEVLRIGEDHSIEYVVCGEARPHYYANRSRLATAQGEKP